MNKTDFIIIFFPFISAFFYALLFFIFQLIENKKYLSKLIFIFIFFILIKFFLIFKFYFIFDVYKIFYSYFVFCLNIFIFMNLIQIPISSLQVKLLRIVEKRKFVELKNLKKIYNFNQIFNERFRTFLNNRTISIDSKNLIKLNNKKIILFYIIFKYIKLIYNVRL